MAANQSSVLTETHAVSVLNGFCSPQRNLLEEDSDEEEDFFLVQSQVDEVIDVMQENISKVIERGERLEDLQDKSGSSAMSLMGRPTSQGNTGGLRDPAWEFSGPGFQEMKAEVTEVPAPLPEDTAGCGQLLSVGEPLIHR
ncbi:hypothetical protein CRUP_018083, partial [Coryphaenoides rupestris]